MIDICDKNYMPSLDEIELFINTEAHKQLHRHLMSEYNPKCSIEYSGEKAFLGWNVKYKKAGRTLCTVYPRDGHFPLLVVIGQKEKDRIVELLPDFSKEFINLYDSTREWMGQRWLMFDIIDQTELLEDIKRVVQVRRTVKRK